MMQFGLITAADGSAASMTMLDAATREQLIAQLVLAVDTVMRLEIPDADGRRALWRRACWDRLRFAKACFRCGDKVDYPPLRTWSVPKGWGRVLGATLAALYVLTLVVPSMTSSMFYVFSGVFEQIFALQGIAAVCYYLHGKGRGRVAQGVVFVLGYFLVQPAALLIGIADQTVRRRPSPRENGGGKTEPV